MACAACIAAAATLPWAGSAAEKLATEDLRLAAITDVDAFSAIPYYIDILSGALGTGAAGLDSINGIPAVLAFLNGDINALGDYDALSAVPVFFGTNGVFTGGGVQALSGYDALSAIPVFQNVANATTPTEAIDALADYDALSAVPVFFGTNGVFTGGGVNALGGYDALSAIDTFFGDNNGQGGVFTGGGINALAPDAEGNGGYAALSALPVFFGTDPAAPFGLGVFTGGGVDALANYDALSAIPAYLNRPHHAMAATTFAAPQTQATLVQDPAPTTKTPPVTNPVKTFVASLPEPKDFTPPAPKEEPKVESVAATTDNGGSNQQNVTRNSNKYTPKAIGDNPLLFGSGTPGVDNGIRGWGSMLKKAGLGGGEGEGDGGS